MQKWLQNKDQIDSTDLLVILVFSSIPDIPDVPSLLFIHMPPYTTSVKTPNTKRTYNERLYFKWFYNLSAASDVMFCSLALTH